MVTETTQYWIHRGQGCTYRKFSDVEGIEQAPFLEMSSLTRCFQVAGKEGHNFLIITFITLLLEN